MDKHVGLEGKERSGGFVIVRLNREGRIDLGRNLTFNKMSLVSLWGNHANKLITIMIVLTRTS